MRLISFWIAHRVEFVEVRSRVEARVLQAGNHQRRHRQIGIGAECDAREMTCSRYVVYAFRRTVVSPAEAGRYAVNGALTSPSGTI